MEKGCDSTIWRTYKSEVRGSGPPETLLPWMTVAALLWLCLATLMSATTILRSQSLNREWLANAVEDMQLSDATESVANQMGFKRAPRVLRSETADVVAVVGWWHP
jgi:hypothetical protein